MLKKKLDDLLNQVIEGKEKNITISLKESSIQDIDQIAKIFSDKSNGNNFSRQTLIEEAVSSLIREGKELLNESYNISNIYDYKCQNDIFQSKSLEYDTVILTGHPDGFKNVFLEEKEWRYAKVSSKKLDRLKYIAIYITSPESKITHYAKIKEYKFDTYNKGYIFKLEGQPIKLEKEIPLGEANSMSVRKPRYVTLKKLKNANTYEDIIY